MSDNIENAGKKGYCLMYFFVGIFLFFSLVIYLYRYNFTLDFG
ncbi:MAG: hypothetical protein AAGG75_20260 [Bacteroidota bacterium]